MSLFHYGPPHPDPGRERRPRTPTSRRSLPARTSKTYATPTKPGSSRTDIPESPKPNGSATVSADNTRLRELRIDPKLNQKTAIEFVDYVIQRLPSAVEVIQTDNGAKFQSAFH